MRTVWLRLRLLWPRREVKREIDEELRFHLEQRTAENVAAGMLPEGAARAARKRFGNVQSVREECREAGGASFGETTLRDIRFGLRMLGRHPGFATVAVLTLALGIGANTAIFSLVHGVVLRPLPYPEPQRLVYLREVLPAMTQTYPTVPVSARHFVEWRQRCVSFESISVIDHGSANLTDVGEPRRLAIARVSANLFDTFGVRPVLGRGFVAGEDQAGQERIVVLSDRLWRQTFHAEPGIVGKRITLDNAAHTVVGVLPAGFRFPAASAFELIGRMDREPPEVFKPKVFPRGELGELMGRFNYVAVGRLKKGVTAATAREELNVIGAQLATMSGEQVELRAEVEPLQEAVTGKSGRGLFLLLGGVGAVLLIACLNLAILMLARTEQRGHESAIRKALGASRAQLLRQALTESLLLAFLGGALGVAVAAAGCGSLIRAAPGDIPRLDEVRMDGSVLLFAVGLTAVTGLLFGLLPAWRMAKAEPQDALKTRGQPASGAVGGFRLRDALITAEVGFSVLLLVTGGLLMNSFIRLMRVEQGFSAPAALVAELALPDPKYGEREQRSRFLERLLGHLANAPGVTSAAVVSALPLEGITCVDKAWVPGTPFKTALEAPEVNVRFISAGYFRTLGIPLLCGRAFEERDRERKVAVISERLARVLWPGQDALGRRFGRNENDEYEVIGVAGDVRADVDKPPVPMVYRPYWEDWWSLRPVAVVAQAAGSPWSIAGAMRSAIRSADAEIPVSAMRTMREVLEGSVAQRRFQMLLVSAFSATALLLTALGIYGVVSYSVARRTNELGLRIALGAQPSDLYRLVLRQGMAPVAAGLLAGVAAALALGRILSSLLYELSAQDPLTIGVAAVVLLVVALLACYFPARRATRLNPMTALRYE